MKISTKALRRNLGLNAYGRGQAYAGYTLFASAGGNKRFLDRHARDIVHRWKLPDRPADYGYLLESGNLLVGVRTGKSPVDFGGRGGQLFERNWDGEIMWSNE